jgi:hypothetical protein
MNNEHEVTSQVVKKLPGRPYTDIPVDAWIPKKEDCIVKFDGKLIIVPFDEIFNKESISYLNIFNIVKGSYCSHLNVITSHINYFLKYYDTDKELLMAYFKLKYIADDKEKKINLHTFIQYVYNVLLTDSIQEKIKKMVKDNYYIDISSNDGKKYNPALEFTNEQAEILMQISTAMKLMIPPMFHFINKIRYEQDRKRAKSPNKVKKNPPPKFKYKGYIYGFYRPLLDIFNGDNGDIDIYNKLWISTNSRINVHHSANKLTWDQRVIYATTPVTHTNDLFQERIICETIFQYVFDKNVINLNHVVLRKQLFYFTMEKYKLDRIELSNTKDANGLTGVDKLEMNAIKTDESIAILSAVNIKKTVKMIEKKMHMKVSKAELSYYSYHMNMSKFQVQLCQYFYAKTFGGYRDLSLINKKTYLKLLIMLKKRLRMQGMVYLPEILTANISGRPNARTIRNDKFLTKIESSAIYNDLISKKYSTLKSIDKNDTIINMLSTIINTKFTIVDYDAQDKYGEPIEINQDMISDEFLNYLNQL